MGYMTNQWVNRGRGLRSRGYSPIGVEVVAENPDDSWSSANRIAVDLSARRSNGEKQLIHIEIEEAEAATPIFVAACRPTIKTQVAVQILAQLTDKQLLRVLAKVLKPRLGKGK